MKLTIRQLKKILEVSSKSISEDTEIVFFDYDEYSAIDEQETPTYHNVNYVKLIGEVDVLKQIENGYSSNVNPQLHIGLSS